MRVVNEPDVGDTRLWVNVSSFPAELLVINQFEDTHSCIMLYHTGCFSIISKVLSKSSTYKVVFIGGTLHDLTDSLSNDVVV